MPKMPGPRHALTDAAAQRLLTDLFPPDDWFDTRMRWYLDEMIRMAHARDIQVVLLHTPVSAVFDKAVESRVTDEDFAKLMQSVRATHPDCVVLDYQDLYRDNDAMFANANHLSFIGAKAWSGRLHADLTEVGILQP
jgi:hypothetical protein